MTTATLSPKMRRPEAEASGHRISVRNARKDYGRLAALDSINLDVEPGRFTVLLGPSGSGKSTLVRSIAGIERLDAGIIRLGETVVNDGARHVAPERRDLAMVFQDYALWPHLTARQNVDYALKRRRLGATGATARVSEMLDRVGLLAKGERYPHELSGGEQQRVALARAVVGKPALLLFDEPLSNLDADLRERLRVEISTLARESGSTSLYITHDQSEAFALADEIGVLRAGRLEQFATPEKIYRDPATPFVARFTGLAGTFVGRVVGSIQGGVTADLGGHLLDCRVTTDESLAGEIMVVIRPTAVRLEPVTAAASGAIPAVVRDIAYRGRGYEHVVECRYGVISGVFDERPWSRGTECAVRIAPVGSIAFAASAT